MSSFNLAELFEDVLRPAIYPKAQDLIDEARRAGCRIVLITGALDFRFGGGPYDGCPPGIGP